MGEGEASRSLQTNPEKFDENLNFHEILGAKRETSRAQSEAASYVSQSDLEQPSVRTGEVGSVGKASSRPGSAMSEPVSVRVERMQRMSRANSRAASVNSSVRHRPAHPNTPSVLNDGHRFIAASVGQSSTGENKSESMLEQDEASSEHSSIHPGGCAAKKLGRLLLSKYTVLTILWIAVQVVAVILISLVTEIVNYNNMVQVTNIDSMISHIGMYASVVNSYLTTHAHLVSQMAQDTLVQEYNLHLHHIAKVKAILENDLVSCSTG